jgi:hypothetical protein
MAMHSFRSSRDATSVSLLSLSSPKHRARVRLNALRGS